MKEYQELAKQLHLIICQPLYNKIMNALQLYIDRKRILKVRKQFNSRSLFRKRPSFKSQVILKL